MDVQMDVWMYIQVVMPWFIQSSLDMQRYACLAWKCAGDYHDLHPFMRIDMYIRGPQIRFLPIVNHGAAMATPPSTPFQPSRNVVPTGPLHAWHLTDRGLIDLAGGICTVRAHICICTYRLMFEIRPRKARNAPCPGI